MKTHPRRPVPRGFTLVELLVTITIIAILAASAYGAYGLLIAKFKMRESQLYAKGLAQAVTSFQSEYGERFLLGDGAGGGEGDVVVSTEKGSETVKILLAKDIRLNPKGLDFLGGLKQAVPDNKGGYRSGLVIEGDTCGAVDAWGNPYQISMDADNDNEVDNPDVAHAHGRLKLRTKVLVWSAGADKDEQTWDDNVKSWE